MLCYDQILILVDLIIGISKCFATVVDRIIHSSSLEVKFKSIALLICVTKKHLQVSMATLYETMSIFYFI